MSNKLEIEKVLAEYTDGKQTLQSATTKLMAIIVEHTTKEELLSELEKMTQSRNSWEEMHQTAMAEWRKCVDDIVALKKEYEILKVKADWQKDTIQSIKTRNNELTTALTKIHKASLYQVHKDDNRLGHLPFDLFDEIEKILEKQ